MKRDCADLCPGTWKRIGKTQFNRERGVFKAELTDALDACCCPEHHEVGEAATVVERAFEMGMGWRGLAVQKAAELVLLP